MNLTIQPPTVPDRLKGGHSLRLKGCVIDAEEQGDQNALGLRFTRQVEEKILYNILILFRCKGPPLHDTMMDGMLIW